MKKAKNVIVGLPVYDGRIGLKTYSEVIDAQNDPNSCVVGHIQLLGDSLVTRARNKVVKRFLETKHDYLMFVDSDIQFSKKQIDTLYNHNKPLIGGVYLKKKLPYSPVCNRFLGKEDGLIKMAELGTGFLMIHRDVFADIRKAAPEHIYRPEGDEEKGDYYDYFRVGVVEGRYLSEDYYFCYLARKAGYDVFMDENVLVTHIGHAAYPFRDEDLLNGAADLLRNYDLNTELNMDIVNRIEDAIQHQRENRKGEQAEDSTVNPVSK